MNNRRNTGIIATLGCLALLLIIALPVGLALWAFRGGLNLDLPAVGGTRETQVAPQPQARQPEQAQQTPGTEDEEEENVPLIPESGNEPGNLAEPVIEPPENLSELYDQANPGTVSILVGVQSGGQTGAGAGSGFVLTDDGYIVTNDHVVEGGDIFVVRFFNEVDLPAEVIGVDPDSDLAIIKVEQLPEGAYPLPLGDSNEIRVGDSVVAIGNPFSLGTSMSYGIISAVGRTIPSITPQFNIPQAIQTDAAINPGNSGGPLINMRGEVIGVNAQIRTAEGGGGNVGIGFAIPVNILKQVYPSLIESGFYTWPYLGVSSPVDVPGFLMPEEVQAAGDGAYIADVVPGGPAAQAGLQAGDVVTQVDGQNVNDFDDLLSYIAFKRPGDSVQLAFLRNGQQQETTVTLGERPSGGLQ